ncbi:hypothetical protein [Nostoc sp. UHCC 0252]|uniref:hypothetical protein n=1 Tax=Nostoc sp. UHCC 0252 TaxID=3110241 RepID=UPI002B21BDFA|nr:hypothetical protein [Nostoc sp. UHCC 0252]MEA5605245.1 hypothetical protein [Nostoc sp. UHCC 0252]
MQQISEQTLLQIEHYFHELIRERARDLIDSQKLELPKLAPILNSQDSAHWFPIPGMYGGFSYWLAVQDQQVALITESWCRVVGGSGQRHKITDQGIELLEEGFV